MYVAKSSETKGLFCTLVGAASGSAVGVRAWHTWGQHGLSQSFLVGLVLAGLVVAALDVTLRMRTEEEWGVVAFDADAGARIDGWPAWVVGILLSLVAMLAAPVL